MSTENKSSRSKLIPILCFVLVISLVSLYGFFFLSRKDNIIQGEADITEVRISSKVPGRIEKFFFEEGNYVKKGDTLAILSAPDIDAKYAQATAAYEGASAESQKAARSAREEQVQNAFSLWQKAKVNVDIAHKTFVRVNNLYLKGVNTAQKKDEAEASYNGAIEAEKAAHSQYTMAVNGAQIEDRKAAVAMVNKAQGAIDEAHYFVGETFLISPVDGRVSERFPNVGELVSSGAPIMSIMDLNDKWGSFNIREDLLKDFQINETISVYVPALHKEVNMKIYYIKDLGSYAAWKATKTTGSYDRKTFEVKAHFLEDNNSILPGMSLIVETN